jgi:integrase
MTYICKVSDLYPRKAAGGNLCFRYQKPDGSWAEKSTGTDKRREAERVRRDFQQKMESGQLPTDMASWSVSEAEEWWIEQRRPPATEESTWNSERFRLKHFTRIVGAKRKLRDIQNYTLDEYVRRRRDEGVGEWSIKKEMFLWKLVLDKANLFEPLRRRWPRLTPKASEIGQALPREQLRHLATTAMSNPEWAQTFFKFVLAANNGMRGGEIKKLKVGTIDLENRELRVIRRFSKTDGRGFNIPLNMDALEAATQLLQRYYAICKDLGIEPSSDHYLLPFNWSRVNKGPTRGRRGYDPRKHQVDWGTSWASLTKEAGFSGFRFHDLRHSFISHMVERGISLERIQTMVGQLSTRMVRHYTHVATKVLHRDVAVLDSEPILPRLTASATAQESVN